MSEFVSYLAIFVSGVAFGFIFGKNIAESEYKKNAGSFQKLAMDADSGKLQKDFAEEAKKRFGDFKSIVNNSKSDIFKKNL